MHMHAHAREWTMFLSVKSHSDWGFFFSFLISLTFLVVGVGWDSELRFIVIGDFGTGIVPGTYLDSLLRARAVVLDTIEEKLGVVCEEHL